MSAWTKCCLCVLVTLVMVEGKDRMGLLMLTTKWHLLWSSAVRVHSHQVGNICNLKDVPTLQNKPTHLFRRSCYKDAFLSKVHPPIYAIVHVVMFSKKHQGSSIVQEEGLSQTQFAVVT